MPTLPEDTGPLSFSLLEYAPKYVVNTPLFVYALWLALRYRSASLPAIANPSILIGGISGESKTDLAALLGPIAESSFAPFITIRADEPLAQIKDRLARAGLAYPLVAKPDIGLNGRGVKIIARDEELLTHLSKFPSDAKLLLQRYIAAEGEVGVFYVRKPSEAKGRITSLTLKYFPAVVGDGHSTLRELILRDPRAKKIAHIYLKRNARDLDRVIPAGTRHRLVSVGNHVFGSIFIDGKAHITPAMTDAFDRIAKDIRGFYFGRFDVRFENLEDLKNGKNFTIIEYNGASSEPTHVWDPRARPFAIWRDLMGHWRLAFEVGAEHRARGVKTIPLSKVLRINRSANALIKQYPNEE